MRKVSVAALVISYKTRAFSRILELMVGHYQNFRYFWRYLPGCLVEYYHISGILASLPEFPVFKC